MVTQDELSGILRSGDGITSHQIIYRHGIPNPAGAIYRLRKHGHLILTKRECSEINGRAVSIAKYFLKGWFICRFC